MQIKGAVYTTKQMGDACEMLVAAELTLAGVPALRVPDFWPGYDVIAQPRDLIAQPTDRKPLRISVKSRTFKSGGGKFVTYLETDIFDWLAIVLLPGEAQKERQIFLVPRKLADEKARKDKPTSKTAKERYFRIDEVAKIFADFKESFSLKHTGKSSVLVSPEINSSAP
jgi:hypothetical protein